MTESNFKEFLKKFVGAATGKFEPFVYVDSDWIFLEVCWKNSASYGEYVGNGITLMKSQETDEIVGVEVSGLKELLG